MRFESMLEAFPHARLGAWLKEAEATAPRNKAGRIAALAELYPTPRAQRAMLAAKLNVDDLRGVLGYFSCASGSTDPNALIDLIFKLPNHL